MRFASSLLLTASAAISIASPLPSDELVLALETQDEAAGQLSVEVKGLVQCGLAKLAIANGKAPYQVQIAVPNSLIPDAPSILYQADLLDEEISWPVQAYTGTPVLIQVQDADHTFSAVGHYYVEGSDDESCLLGDSGADLVERGKVESDGGSGGGDVSANWFSGGNPNRAWKRGEVDNGGGDAKPNWFSGGNPNRAWKRGEVDNGGGDAKPNWFSGGNPNRAWKRGEVDNGGGDVKPNWFSGGNPTRPWKRDQVNNGGGDVKPNWFSGGNPTRPW